MDITYLEVLVNPSKVDHKPAKISQEKLNNLKNNYKNNLKVTAPTVETNIAKEPVNVVPVKEETQVMVASMPTDNYGDVVNMFGLGVYEKSFDELNLTGARKIRINSKLPKHIRLLSEKFASGKLENLGIPKEENVVSMPTVSKVETTSVSNEVVENKEESNVVEFPNVTQVQNTTMPVKDSVSPSVDDYLQKEMPKDDSVITQLTGDVESLKKEAEKRSAILEQLEAKYNELKSKREQRIKDLEEEKLSYTATLEGLTERIRNLQEAIEKEEQTLSGYSKAA